jgi:hypothetical protein
LTDRASAPGVGSWDGSREGGDVMAKKGKKKDEGKKKK